VIEEKLYGNEFSLMSFVDGNTLKHMIPIQDFKRAYNNNEGPNTGSMGSITYANHSLPFLTKDDLEECEKINEKVIECLNQETNSKYKGILYGSFMKTKDDQIKVIEFNARFGDPECINILALLKTDLSTIFDAIVNEKLDKINLEFENKASCCRYLVPKGYPEHPIIGHEIYIDNEIDENICIYGNITQKKLDSNNVALYELGSRTLALIGIGNKLCDAVKIIEEERKYIIGPLYWRNDIGITNFTYEEAGVNIEEGNNVVEKIRSYVESTFNKNVVSEFGDFAGMYRINNRQTLVTSTDGVGTKSILVLEKYGPKKGYEMLGHDLVNHCVNDILVKGAHPLFFLDYYASSKINAKYVKYFVKGLSDACKKVNCVLIGGETAEMPDIYPNDKCDIVGMIVGIVDNNKIINGKQNIFEDDLIIGLPSSGPHTNGYTLIRKLIDDTTPQDMIDNLCEPHKCYYHDIMEMKDKGYDIHGLCHITGGGWGINVNRVIPDDLLPQFEKVEMSNVFSYLQKKGNIEDNEMIKTFNCGTGMLVFISPDCDSNELNVIGKVVGNPEIEEKIL
jgi:phosphoribosylaminoimidazole synthetase